MAPSMLTVPQKILFSSAAATNQARPAVASPASDLWFWGAAISCLQIMVLRFPIGWASLPVDEGLECFG
jgi:hypothetical protein